MKHVLVFLLMTLTGVIGVHFYLFHKFARYPRFSPETQRRIARIFIALVIAAPVARLLFFYFPIPSLSFLNSVFQTWMGFALLMATFFLAVDLLRLLIGLTQNVIAMNRTRLKKEQEADSPEDLSRRTFISRSFVASTSTAAVITGGAGVASALCSPRVVKIQVPVARFPSSLSGFKIVQISDLHVGITIRKPFVENVVQMANELEPDLIALTGDFVDGHIEDLAEHVEPLRKLKAKHGVFYITGNHEYYSGVEIWKKHFASMGFRVLDNELVTIGEGEKSFDLAGVDWEKKLSKALETHDGNKALILLQHEPRGIDKSMQSGVGLQLSGHTHGGQIWPFGYFVALVQPYVRGLHKHGDGYIYVSCGTGFWGPAMRVGAPSEVTSIEILSPS